MTRALFAPFLLLGWALLDSSSILSDPPGKAPTEFECRFTEGPIQVDGKGDDEAWRHAQVIDRFYLPWLRHTARPAHTATKTKLLWDREYLYFFADMEDSDLCADAKEADGPKFNSDLFALFLMP